MAQNHERINQTINSFIACLRFGRRILEDCTAEIVLVELGEILDGAVERVDGTNLLRIRGDRQRVSLRGLEVHGAGQGVAVDDERQATSGEHVWAVQETEVQVGTERRAGVPDLGQRRADLHGVANLHPQTSRLQVPVDRVDLGGDLQHDLVAAEVRQRFRGYHLVRGRVRLAVLDRDDGPIGDREHIRSVNVELLVRGALPLIDPVALEEGPVDSERLGGLDAATVDDDSKIPMEVGCAAGGGGEPTIPLEGRLDHGGGAAVDRDLGAVDHGRVHEHRSRCARRNAVGEPVRHPFRRSAGRHDQIDVDRDRRRRGDLRHRLFVQEGLGRGDEQRPVDPRELLRGGIE